MFPPELYAAVKRIEASAAPLLRSSAERIVILDTHVVLECTLWRDESESDSPLGCALKAGRIVPAASHETLLELAGVAARPVKQMLEAEAAARALTMLERWGKLIRMPSKDMLTEKDIPDHAYDSIDDPESTGGKAEPNKNSNDAGSHEISQDLWRKPHHTRLRADWESTLKLPIFHFSRQYIPHLYRG